MAFNRAHAGVGILLALVGVGGGLYVGGAFDGYIDEETVGVVRSKEPGYGHILADDNDYAGLGYSSKYGGKYYSYFVGVGIKNRVDGPKAADDGGQGSFKENYEGFATGGFSKINIKTGEQLRDACKSAYKGTLNTKTRVISEKGKTYKEEDVGKFCSPVGKAPVAISDREGYASGTIGATKRNKLASTKHNRDRFGEIKKNLFFKTSNEVKETFFKQLKDKQIKQGTEHMALRDKCEEAYNTKAVSSSTKKAPTEAEVLKYCSLEESK